MQEEFLSSLQGIERALSLPFRTLTPSSLVASSSVHSSFKNPFNLGILSDNYSINDSVTAKYPNDYYKFQIYQTQRVELSLSPKNPRSRAYIELLDSSGERIRRSSKRINKELEAGSYYAHVYRSHNDSDYQLSIKPESLSNTGSPVVIPPQPLPTPSQPSLSPDNSSGEEQVDPPKVIPPPVVPPKPSPTPSPSIDDNKDSLYKRSKLSIQGKAKPSLNENLRPRDNHTNFTVNEDTASWNNGVFTFTPYDIDFRPNLPSSSQKSQEYFPIATVRFTNRVADKEEFGAQGITGLSLFTNFEDLLIENKAIKKNTHLHNVRQQFEFRFRGSQNGNPRYSSDDQIILPGNSEVIPIRMDNPLTAEVDNIDAPFYYTYAGAIEGKPREIKEGESLLSYTAIPVAEGESKEFTLYGNIVTQPHEIVHPAFPKVDFYRGADFKPGTKQFWGKYLDYINEVHLPAKGKILVDSTGHLLPGQSPIDGILAGSFSAHEGLHLDTAAKLLGYDHFNWYQELISDTSTNIVRPAQELLPTGASIDDYELSFPMVDPSPYSAGNSTADSLPYYWDEKDDLLAFIEEKLGIKRALNIETNIRDNRLFYFDEPKTNIPEEKYIAGERAGLRFITSLVGVHEQGSQEFTPFYSREWYTNFNPLAQNYQDPNLRDPRLSSYAVGGVQLGNPIGAKARTAPFPPSIENGGIILSKSFSYQNKEYKLSRPGTWEQAQEEARKAGGNLVSIDDIAEEDWLLGTFGRLDRAWIGLTDRESEGNWKWVDDTVTNSKVMNFSERESQILKFEHNDFALIDIVSGRWAAEDEQTNNIVGIIEIGQGKFFKPESTNSDSFTAIEESSSLTVFNSKSSESLYI